MESHPVYEVLEEIGQGDSATVYRARDLALKRYVAIKELHEKLRRDPRQMEHFWAEAQFLANLTHDHIVQVHGLDKERGWIIMELMRGSLAAKLARGPLPADLVRSVLRQALGGLKYLHGQGKLHGAVKPANLLINDQGRVKLSDPAGTLVGGEVRKPTGTAKYLAPELLNPAFGAVGPAADLYGLGFTALELLKGPDFDGLFKGVGPDAIDPELAWLRWHSSASEKLPPTRELVPQVPPDLARVIDRLLAKEVSERFAGAAEALKDLEDRPLLLVDLPAEAAPAAREARKPSGPAVVPIGGTPPPVPPAPPRKAAAKPAAKPGPGARPSTREWLNQQLKKPLVLYPLLALILIPALVFLFWPTPERPAPITIRVTSEPDKAIVFLGNGKPRTAPAEFHLEPGSSHHLRLNLEGYDSKEADISVQAGDEGKEFHYKLEPSAAVAEGSKGGEAGGAGKEGKVTEKGTGEELATTAKDRETAVVVPDRGVKVHIASVPPEALLWVDDKQQGKTDADLYLAPGAGHRLRLTREGYEPREETISVQRGEEGREFSYDLKPTPRRVRIRSKPAGAAVSVNGAVKGRTDDVLVFEVGTKNRVVLEKTGFKPYLVKEDLTFLPGAGTEELGPYDLEPVPPVVTPPPAEPHRYVLLVGVQDYKDPRVPRFPNARADMADLSQTLLLGGYRAEDLVLLTAPPGEGEPSMRPTEANVRHKLTELAGRCTERDALLVALEGLVVRWNGAEAYFCPSDAWVDEKANMIPLREVFEALRECKAGVRILLMDGYRNDPRVGEFQSRLGHRLLLGPGKVDLPPGVAAFFGSTPAEEGSYNHSEARHGVFFHFVIQGLRGLADQDADHEITLPELVPFVKSRVRDYVRKEYSQAQTPESLGTTGQPWPLTRVQGALVHYEQGCNHLEKEEYAPAVAELTKAVAEEKTFTDAFLRLATAYYNSGRFDQAIRVCEESNKQGRKDPVAYYILGEALAARGRTEEAIAAFDQSLELDPQYPPAYNSRGIAYRQQKEYQKALQDQDKAHQLDPFYAPALNSRGLTLAAQKDYDQAIRAYDEAIRIKPGLEDAWVNRGMARRKTDRLAEAIADLKKAAELDPKDAKAWTELGMAYAAHKDYRPAIEAYTRALDLKPGNSELLRLRAEASKKAGPGGKPVKRPGP